eukprot:1193764-Prorocentrum_minimum.AAC.3
MLPTLNLSFCVVTPAPEVAAFTSSASPVPAPSRDIQVTNLNKSARWRALHWRFTFRVVQAS